jgi:hypothetical protein
MKSIGFLMIFAIAFAFCLPMVSCSEEEDETESACRGQCKGSINEYDDCMQEYYGCEIEDKEGYIDECVSECKQALNNIDSGDKKDVIKCFNCMIDEVGSDPDCGDVYDALEGDCEEVCEEDGLDEYYEEFDTVEIPEEDIDC